MRAQCRNRRRRLLATSPLRFRNYLLAPSIVEAATLRTIELCVWPLRRDRLEWGDDIPHKGMCCEVLGSGTMPSGQRRS